MGSDEHRSIDELAKAGAKQRLAQEKRQRAEADDERQRSEKRAEKASKVEASIYESAFYPTWFAGLRVGLGAILAAPSIGAAVFALQGRDMSGDLQGLVYAGVSVLCIALGVVLTIPLKRRLIRRGKLWIEQVPFKWNPDAYRELLRREFGFVVLELSVTTGSPVAAADRQKLEDALRALATDATPTWADETQLSFYSSELNMSPGSHLYLSYRSRAIHRWFKTLIDKALPVVHREWKIEEINCTGREPR